MTQSQLIDVARYHWSTTSRRERPVAARLELRLGPSHRSPSPPFLRQRHALGW
jgi:hypothetical protein